MQASCVVAANATTSCNDDGILACGVFCSSWPVRQPPVKSPTRISTIRPCTIPSSTISAPSALHTVSLGPPLLLPLQVVLLLSLLLQVLVSLVRRLVTLSFGMDGEVAAVALQMTLYVGVAAMSLKAKDAGAAAGRG